MRPGDIVLVKFPFANLTQTKKRPALVLSQVDLSEKDELITIAMVTSQIDALEIEGDVQLDHWKEAGLLHPSRVRLAKIATLDETLIDKKLGRIADPDSQKIRANLSKVFRHWL